MISVNLSAFSLTCMMHPPDRNLLPSDTDLLKAQVGELHEGDFAFRQSVKVIRWVGYAFLIFTLMQWIYLLVPLKFMNPNWEFQTIGGFVEQVIIPLLGFALVFFGADLERRRWEFSLVKVLSWLCLVLGLFYLLMVPLGIVNTVRINEINKRNLLSRQDQRIEVIERVKSQVSAIATQEQLQILLSELQQAGLSIQAKPGQPLTAIKTDLTKFMDSTQAKFKTGVSEAGKARQFQLYKNSIRWNLGALIAGIWFIYLWRLSEWTRIG